MRRQKRRKKDLIQKLGALAIHSTFQNGNAFKIDDMKDGKIINPKNIVVDSAIAGIELIAVSDPTGTVQAHLFGDVECNGDKPVLKLTENTEDEETRIEVVWNGNTFISDNFRLCISVPVGYELDKLFAKSQFSYIDIVGFKVTSIIVSSMSGNIKIWSDATRYQIDTMSSDIDMKVSAFDDVSIKIDTMSGDVEIELDNVLELDSNIATMSGRVENRFKSSGQSFLASAFITTMSGDIKFKQA